MNTQSGSDGVYTLHYKTEIHILFDFATNIDGLGRSGKTLKAISLCGNILAWSAGSKTGRKRGMGSDCSGISKLRPTFQANNCFCQMCQLHALVI